MKQSDLFLQGEGDRWHERNRDKPRLPDPVIEAMQVCQLQPKNVLELGCGNGWRLAEMQKIWNGVGARGYDASDEAIRNKVWGHVWKKDILEALTWEIGPARYDIIIFGFCLYLVDREDLMMIAAHTDRVLQDKGYIIIHDFNDDQYKVRYKHKEGVWSYHQDYSRLWLGTGAYKWIDCIVHNEDNDGFVAVLQKDIAAGWPERAGMTRDEAIKKIQDYIIENDITNTDRSLVRHAFDGATPMRGCLLMLEALGLVKFEDSGC